MRKTILLISLLFQVIIITGQNMNSGWDLSSFYKNHEDWKIDRDYVTKKIDSLSNLTNTEIDNQQKFVTFFSTGSDLRKRVSRLLIYSIFKIDSDTSSNEFQELYTIGTALEAQLEGQLSKIETSILKLPIESIENWSSTMSPAVQRRIYRVLQLREHTLSPSEMELIKEMQGFQYTTADSYWALRNAIDYPSHINNNDTINCNPGAYYRLCNLADQPRKEGLDKMFQSLSNFQDLLALLYQKRIELDKNIGAKLHFDSGISARWKIRDHIPVGSIDKMITALDSNTSVVQRYVKAKSKILGKERMEYPDLYKVIDVPGYDYSLISTTSNILNSVDSNPRLKSTFESIINKPITNIPFKENKQYTYGIYPPITGEPYFMMNYLPNHKNARALSGAYFLMAAWTGLPQSFLPDSRDDGPIYSNGVIYLGDLYHDNHLINKESVVERKKKLLINTLDFYWYYGVRWMVMAKMDSMVEGKLKNGESLTGKQINELYGSLLDNLFNSEGNLVDIDANAQMEWNVYPIPFGSYEHHYWPIALSFASKVFLESNSDKELLNSILFDLPRLEKMDRSYDMLKTVGIDLNSEDLFTNPFKVMEYYLDQLEKLNY